MFLPMFFIYYICWIPHDFGNPHVVGGMRRGGSDEAERFQAWEGERCLSACRWTWFVLVVWIILGIIFILYNIHICVYIYIYIIVYVFIYCMYFFRGVVIKNLGSYHSFPGCLKWSALELDLMDHLGSEVRYPWVPCGQEFALTKSHC